VEHLAIDLGKRESQLCLRNERGEIVDEARVGTEEIGAYLRKHPSLKRVVLETCAEAFDVADEVVQLGHEVRVVPATLAKALGVGNHGIKTDRRDARALSIASAQTELGSVHIPSKTARERKALCGNREALVASRTKLVNNARGYLRTRRITVKAGTAASFVKRTRAALENTPQGLPMGIERALRGIQALSDLIAEADQELKAIALADPVCKLLMTMPGVGPVTSIRFQSAIDDYRRFPNGHRMQSYLGLTPGERSSSDRKRVTGITKAGPTQLRWVLVQAAWSLWRTRKSDPLVLWAQGIAARRGKAVAILALARKMSSVLRAMWLSGQPYEPLHISK
jgi:transposase